MTVYSLPVVAEIPHQRYQPGPLDPVGLPQPGTWASATPVNVHGWWQPTADQIGVEVGRRAQEVSRVMLVTQGTTCGDRDLWTLPDGEFEQVGAAQDNSHGPFGMKVPLIVYLKTLKG